MNDKSVREDLEGRVNQFMRLELPGQPMIMHMGTSMLVWDLWSAYTGTSAPLAPAEKPSGLHAGEGSPKDGTREPLYNSYQRDMMNAAYDPSIPKGFVQHGEVPQSIQNVYKAARASAHPVPQEGVSAEMIDAAMKAYFKKEPHSRQWLGSEGLIAALEVARAPLLEENARLREVSHFHFAGQAAAEARIKELERGVGSVIKGLHGNKDD